jgi:hypothetical protein
MRLDPEALASWLSAIGSAQSEGDDPDQAFAQQLMRRNLGRDADVSARQGIIGALRNGLKISDIEVLLRSSYERLVADRYLAGQNSETFRRLRAISDVERLPASGTDISECVALHRVLLGTEPDSTSFAKFLDHRPTQLLADAVREVLRSPEAAAYYAPAQVPPLSVALPAVVLVASQVLHAAASDIALGSVIAIDAKVDALGDRLEALEKKIDRLAETMLLRLDGEALGI